METPMGTEREGLPPDLDHVEADAAAGDADVIGSDVIGVAVDLDRRDRLWVGAITKFLASRISTDGSYRPVETVPSGDDLSVRVRHALDMATIAACERLTRIMRGDQSGAEADTGGDRR
jgi:hypothetical protein